MPNLEISYEVLRGTTRPHPVALEHLEDDDVSGFVLVKRVSVGGRVVCRLTEGFTLVESASADWLAGPHPDERVPSWMQPYLEPETDANAHL